MKKIKKMPRVKRWKAFARTEDKAKQTEQAIQDTVQETVEENAKGQKG